MIWKWVSLAFTFLCSCYIAKVLQWNTTICFWRFKCSVPKNSELVVRGVVLSPAWSGRWWEECHIPTILLCFHGTVVVHSDSDGTWELKWWRDEVDWTSQFISLWQLEWTSSTRPHTQIQLPSLGNSSRRNGKLNPNLFTPVGMVTFTCHWGLPRIFEKSHSRIAFIIRVVWRNLRMVCRLLNSTCT